MIRAILVAVFAAFTAVLTVVVTCLLTTVLEIGSSTEAEAAVNCCPVLTATPESFSPGSNGGPGFCISIDPNSGAVTQTPAPASCNSSFSQLSPSNQAAEIASYRSWFQQQMNAVEAQIVFDSLSRFFGIPPEIGGINFNGVNIGTFGSGVQSWGANNYIGGSFLGSGLHDNGGTITTTGVPAPGFSGASTNLGFEIHDIYDASRYLHGADRQLLFGGYFFYNNELSSFGPVGSARSDDYTFIGAAAYRQGNFYTIGQLGGGFAPTSITNAATGGTGGSTSGSFLSDLKIGYLFPLIDPRRAGWGLSLDVSGHGGYLENTLGGFVDSVGTATGSTQAHSGLVGGEAKLSAAFARGGLMWTPYIGVTFDDWVGLHDTNNIPGGGVLTLQEGEAFWGGEGGLAAASPNGVKVTVSGFYKASSTTTIGGGSVSLSVPWNVLAGGTSSPPLITK
jgi:hypothetical protein